MVQERSRRQWVEALVEEEHQLVLALDPSLCLLNPFLVQGHGICAKAGP